MQARFLTDQRFTSPSSTPVLDWPNGRVLFSGPAETDQAAEWSFIVCGDWAPSAGQERAIAANPTDFYGDLLPILRDADLRIVNLECVLLDAAPAQIVKDGDALSAPTDTIAGLTIVPFQLACLANNHILDYGLEGLAATQRLLEDHRIRSIGAGRAAAEAEAPQIFTVSGVSLGIVNIAEGEEARAVDGCGGAAALYAPDVDARLAELRGQVDLLLVVVHAGREYLPVPAPHIRQRYRALVEAGADIVVGHHPHVAQGIEIYQGAPIVYSLGNFAFALGTGVESHDQGYMLKARFRGRSLVGLEIWPYHIATDRMRLLESAQAQAFFARLSELSAIITDDNRIDELWHAYADRWLVTNGEQELNESVAQLSHPTVMVEATLKAMLAEVRRARLIDRLARRALESTITWLQHRRLALRSEISRPYGLGTRRGAAILRNRFDTPSHRELYLTALERVMEGTNGCTAAWAEHFLDDWRVFW